MLTAGKKGGRSMEKRDPSLPGLEPERREFLKKVATAAAFAVPAIATVSLDGVGKKAFAQAAYDQPVVTSVVDEFNSALVTFSQPMDTSFNPDAANRARGVGLCSTFAVQPGLYLGAVWVDDMHQRISFYTCGSGTLTATYNLGTCTEVRYQGKNGLELVPYSGNIIVTGDAC
jgi:hypothetical protein